MNKEKLIGGYVQFPNALVRNNRLLSAPALRLLLIILSYKRAYPSYRTIQKQSGLSNSSVSKAIKELSNLNIISISHGHRKGKSNLYIVNPSSVWSIDIPIAKSREPLIADVEKNTTLTSEDDLHELEISQNNNYSNNNRNKNHQPVAVEVDSGLLWKRKTEAMNYLEQTKKIPFLWLI